VVERAWFCVGDAAGSRGSAASGPDRQQVVETAAEGSTPTPPITAKAVTEADVTAAAIRP
jgi:hypothetical protein